MEKEEKLIKNKMSIASIVASVMLLSIVLLGASYAFFSDQMNGTDDSLTFGNGLNVSFTLDAGNSIDFDFNPLEMTNATADGTQYIDSTPGNGTVTLENHSGKQTITCEYEVWYKALSTFENKDKKKDISLITQITSENDTENEVNLNEVAVNSDRKISDEYITVNGVNATATQKWTFKFRHFILPDVNQNEHLGQSFSGQVYFKAKKCYEGTKASS